MSRIPINGLIHSYKNTKIFVLQYFSVKSIFRSLLLKTIASEKFKQKHISSHKKFVCANENLCCKLYTTIAHILSLSLLRSRPSQRFPPARAKKKSPAHVFTIRNSPRTHTHTCTCTHSTHTQTGERERAWHVGSDVDARAAARSCRRRRPGTSPQTSHAKRASERTARAAAAAAGDYSWRGRIFIVLRCVPVCVAERIEPASVWVESGERSTLFLGGGDASARAAGGN